MNRVLAALVVVLVGSVSAAQDVRWIPIVPDALVQGIKKTTQVPEEWKDSLLPKAEIRPGGFDLQFTGAAVTELSLGTEFEVSFDWTPSGTFWTKEGQPLRDVPWGANMAVLFGTSGVLKMKEGPDWTPRCRAYVLSLMPMGGMNINRREENPDADGGYLELGKSKISKIDNGETARVVLSVSGTQRRIRVAVAKVVEGKAGAPAVLDVSLDTPAKGAIERGKIAFWVREPVGPIFEGRKAFKAVIRNLRITEGLPACFKGAGQ